MSCRWNPQNPRPRLLTLAFALAAPALAALAPPQAQALECQGMEVSDEEALDIANHSFAGVEHRVSKRKTLVVNWIISINGGECKVAIEADVTMKRKVRRNAHGTMKLEGKLALIDGDVCMIQTRVTDFDLSHTSKIGEFVYEKMAGELDLCL
ncbi:MAG: hypothetical protein R6X02_21420 [Enhygromyxa sp.]